MEAPKRSTMIVNCPVCGHQREVNPTSLLGSKGGQSTSEAKRAAARENGKKRKNAAPTE